MELQQAATANSLHIQSILLSVRAFLRNLDENILIRSPMNCLPRHVLADR